MTVRATRGASDESFAEVTVNDHAPRTFCPWCGEVAPADGVCPSCERDVTDTRIGAVLAGKYRLDGLLGQGGMGRVYRATHLALGEPVAVKFLLSELSARPEVRARFKREAVALARLRHPGIVAVHDFGEDDGALFMVMELVRGHAVIDELAAPGQRIAPERALELCDQVLAVLEAAHAQGIVHRDLKPENVMVLDAGDRTLRVKVLDFGLALMNDQEGGARLTRANTVRGTPLYMAPEQCMGNDIGPEVDVYAAGVMLYEMLCGEPPFAPDAPTVVMSQHVFAQPPSMRERVPGYEPPPGLEALVLRALAKKPAERPTAQGLREQLALVRRGQDPESLRQRAAAERAALGTLSREERALAPAPSAALSAGALARTEVNPGLDPAGLAGGAEGGALVLLEALAPSRGALLRAALGVHGVEARGALDAGQAPRCVLLGGGAAAVERVRALRASAATRRVPVLVLDASGTEATAALIRAGASDVCPPGAGDDAVCQKVLRLLRRGR